MALVAVGQRAPAFALTGPNGQPMRLSDWRGKIVVLYFYPKDDTPGCTREACGFRDAIGEFRHSGADVIGISRDSTASHQRFTDKYQLPFTLLSDPEAQACKAYGVYAKKSLYGRLSWGIERATFVIDPEGKIAAVFPKVKVDGHIDEVLRVIRELAQPSHVR